MEENILEPVRDYIIEHGWFQGEYIDPETGKVCLLGAARRVNQTNDDNNIHAEELGRRVFKAANVSVPMWNDSPTRTLDDILTLCSDKWETMKGGDEERC